MRSLTRRALGALLSTFLALSSPALAHEGHDHGAPATVPASQRAPTLQAMGGEVQLVAVADGAGHLVLYVDRLATNEPVAGATVSISADGGPEVAATAQADGTYLLEAPWSQVPGAHLLVATVAGEGLADLLDGALVVPPAAAGEAGDHGHGWGGGLLPLGLAFAGGLLVAFAAGRVGRRATAALVLGALALGSVPADAHEGHDHGAEATAPPATGNAPRRLPDGSLFVPKATQRLLEIRTQVVQPGKVARTATLAGRTVADPDASGRAMASQSGRVEPPEGGMPILGQRVEAGQVLAWVVPAVDTVERGDVQERIADVEKQLEIARRQVARLSRLQGVVAQREIDDARAQLAGLEKQREALRPTLARKEAVRAPVSGTIARVGAVPGQVIDDRDEAVLFELVDPTRLLVEAVAFDPALATGVAGATLVAGGGQSAKLSFLGSGPERRESAIPLVFRVEGAAGALGVGTPVRVHATLDGAAEGMVLPRDAVVRGPDGLPLVWEQVMPLSFVPRAVRMRPLDGQSVVVEAGVGPGARVVVRGAALLNQVR